MHETTLMHRVWNRLRDGTDNSDPDIRAPHQTTVERVVTTALRILEIPVRPDGTIDVRPTTDTSPKVAMPSHMILIPAGDDGLPFDEQTVIDVIDVVAVAIRAPTSVGGRVEHSGDAYDDYMSSCVNHDDYSIERYQAAVELAGRVMREAAAIRKGMKPA